MQTLSKATGLKSGEIVAFRIKCIELLEKEGWCKCQEIFPGLSKTTIYRWRRMYLSNKHQAKSLIPKSTRPKKVKQMVIPPQIMGFVKSLRQQYPHLSKYKIKYYLDAFCKEQDLHLYSASWIGKLIKRYRLFFNEPKPSRRKKGKLITNRVKYTPKVNEVALGYIQLDGVTVYFEGRKHYFLCALELKTRQAQVKRVTSMSSLQAKLFIEEVTKTSPYPIHTIQTDNGSEFKLHFDQALQELNITHLFGAPHKPKTNAFVERFNQTLQVEFVDYHLDLVQDDTPLFDQKLSIWMNFYNTSRPHQGLNYKTPKQQLMLELAQINTQKGLAVSAKCV